MNGTQALHKEVAGLCRKTINAPNVEEAVLGVGWSGEGQGSKRNAVDNVGWIGHLCREMGGLPGEGVTFVANV